MPAPSRLAFGTTASDVRGASAAEAVIMMEILYPVHKPPRVENPPRVEAFLDRPHRPGVGTGGPPNTDRVLPVGRTVHDDDTAVCISPTPLGQQFRRPRLRQHIRPVADHDAITRVGPHIRPA